MIDSAESIVATGPVRIPVARLLDDSRWSGLQKSVVFLTALTIVFDGLDNQMIGFAVPAIAKDWGVARAAFGPILAFGLVGMSVGTALGGMLGDRIGRRMAMILSVVLFGAATLGFAFTHSLHGMFVLRMIAGLGIGGAVPNATTLAAEFTPANRRPIAVSATIVCVPIGGLLAGLISAQVLATGNWRTLFYIGGIAPLALAALLLVVLPESPRYLARHAERRRELLTLLRRMAMPVREESEFEDERPVPGIAASSFSEIVGKGKLRNTLSLWFAFFCCLLSVYLVFNWLPSVLTGLGLDLKTSSQGLAAYNFGGIFGSLLFAWWVNRKGSRLPMVTGAIAAAATALLARAVPIHPHGDHTLLLAALALHGLFVNAVQVTMFALAAHIYTTRARATGVALAVALGRTGAIASAFLGSSLLAYSVSTYFATLAVGMVGACVGLLLLRHHIEPSA
jgi:AAHS family 4-hydroxybenzoate transporter-like MFS transporter